MRIFQLAFVALFLLRFNQAKAEESAAESEAQKIEASLKYEEGEITIGKNLAKISLPPDLRYLNPEDAEKVLVDLWGNPKGGDTLGMLVPSNFKELHTQSWAVVITYQEDGYVKDTEADAIKYDDLLKQMKESIEEANEDRTKEGYAPMHLVGWAAAPHYDKPSHKLFWAKEIRFGSDKENTLNYNIRVLGRKGVLVLNAVSGISDLPMIEKQVPEILQTVSFTEGNRYEDFKPNVDKVAAYGLAALVAGGIAAKAGFFKVLLVGLLAAKKFVIMGVIAVVAGVKKFIFGKDRNSVS